MIARSNFLVSGNGNLVHNIPLQTSVVLLSNETVGLWFYFTDLTRWERTVDSTLPSLGTPATPNTYGDPTWAYLQQGSLRLSAAMQASNITKPNWQNMRPFVSTFNYDVICAVPPLPPGAHAPPPPFRPPTPGAVVPSPPPGSSTPSSPTAELNTDLLIPTVVIGGAAVLLCVGVIIVSVRLRSMTFGAGVVRDRQSTEMSASPLSAANPVQNPFARG
jgi:hypothetical protein